MKPDAAQDVIETRVRAIASEEAMAVVREAHRLPEAVEEFRQIAREEGKAFFDDAHRRFAQTQLAVASVYGKKPDGELTPQEARDLRWNCLGRALADNLDDGAILIRAARFFDFVTGSMPTPKEDA